VVPRPPGPPIGVILARTAKTVSRAFDDTLAVAGGSLPMWLILLSLKTEQLANQRELAQAVGVQGATLTHHLNAMEADGLITRRRDPGNRRVHRVQLTDRGETMFHQLAGAAVAHNQRLCAGLGNDEIVTLGRLLDRLQHNVTADGLRPAECTPAGTDTPRPRRPETQHGS
jgi:MarR family transcriptional regulator for hemolysin